MKWSQIERGRRARKKDVEFTPLDSETPIKVDLRVLDGHDYGTVLEYASAYAKARGGEAKDGDESYEYAKDKMTVLLGVTDPDSPDDKPEQFFGSMDDVDAALDRERICSLANHQRVFQAVTSPFPYSFTPDEFQKHVVDMAFTGAHETHPFVTWPPDLQWNYTRTLAIRHVELLTLRSQSSSSDVSVSSS